MKKLYSVFLLMVVALVSQAQTKNVLVEELTGTWCQWCPRGIYYMDSLISTNPNAIGIAIHVSDPMENDEYADGCGLNSAPSANIDRGAQEASPDLWFALVDDALTSIPKADVEIFTDFEPTTRLLSARVKATFFSPASGDYRLAAVITEDGITGPSPQYNQTNQYSSGNYGPMGGFELLPQSIPANMIAYNHVGRKLLGGYNGQEGSVPASVSAGDTASYIFTFTLPAEWDENYIRIVGLLIAPDGTIDNAAKSFYLDGNSNAAPLFMSEPVTSGFEGTPYVCDIYASDPDDHDLTITAVSMPSWLSMSATTSLGMIHTKVTLTGTPAEEGIFPVEILVSDGQRTKTLSFSITVESELSGSWNLVGQQGFTATSENFGIASDANGTLYAFLTDGSACNVYQKTSSGEWVNYGNLNGQATFGRIRIGSDGLTPYVAYSNDGPVVVKKYASGSWVQIGGSPASGVQLGFDLDANDVPYISLMDFDDNYYGNSFKYDGTSWIKLGGAPFSGSNYGIWSDLKVNKTTGDAYIIWNDGDLSYVSKWDGASWTVLGGGAISNETVAYSQTIEIDETSGHIYAVVANGATTTGVLNAYKFNGTSWEQIGTDEADGQVTNVSTTLNDGRILLISFVDISHGNSVSAISYRDGNWEFIGPRSFSNAIAAYTQITSYQNMPYVLYRDGGASDMATVMYYDSPIISGISDSPVTNDGLLLYPNPASHEINISGLAVPTEAAIYNMQGAIIWKGTASDAQKISTQSFKNGIYLLKAVTKSAIFIVKHNRN